MAATRLEKAKAIQAEAIKALHDWLDGVNADAIAGNSATLLTAYRAKVLDVASARDLVSVETAAAADAAHAAKVAAIKAEREASDRS